MVVRVVIISDTHGHFNTITCSPGDLLIHCGDITAFGTLSELRVFSNFLKSIRHQYRQIVVVPGKRDRCFYTEPEIASKIVSEHGIVLIDSYLNFSGIKLYGTPHVPALRNNAFELDDIKRYDLFSLIPTNLDILITHTPPKWVLDFVQSNGTLVNSGCPILYDSILRVRPQICVFGHIHEGYGYTNLDNITYVNASICDGLNRPTRQPIIIDYNTETKVCSIKV